MQTIYVELETGDTPVYLAEFMKDLHDFLKDQDYDIISCNKVKKKEKRDKDQ